MIEFDEKSHVYRIRGKEVPSVTRILVDLGFIDTTWFTEEGRNRGSAVHGAVQGHCSMGGCMRLSDEVAPYFNAFLAFQKDADWVPHTIEKPMANEQFAGTPDQIGHMNGLEAVLDLKTGGISPATGLQLVGYEILYGKPLRRYALQITPEGKYKITEYKDRNDRYVFQSAVAVWWWRKIKLK